MKLFSFYTKLELTNKLKQQGGNYDGYCDNNLGQCSDSVMCGGTTFNNIVPKERFIKIMKSNQKSKVKISKNLANNLQTIIEKNIHNNFPYLTLPYLIICDYYL